ncbi:MAG: cysteine--tRNA ligase [Crocinitomicaceae bacterium]|nr:cysteine--tRNA ligase [Crocinitomicaceae bacterium]
MQHNLYLYNSLTRQKEKFEAISSPFVGLYVCGPTVYSNVHLGNSRTFMTFDVLFRYLKYLGYKVRYVRNITDVGHITTEFDEGVDRIGAQAKLEMLEPMEVVQKYTVYFHWVMEMFNNLPPSIEPTATGHIIEQIEMVKKILDAGFAYEINGSVYFDVRAYLEKHKYGELSGRNVEELFENTRDLDGQDEKKFFADFALWKNASAEHIMRWPSPWGEGFPGWHLECSAMSTKYLGEVFDIHGGGMDLKFPHHESEVAQNTAACGHGPVRYWLHANMLTVNGQKMSKSLGNSFLPHELFSGDHPVLTKGYSPMVVRFFMMQAHYRSPLDFSNEAIQAAAKGYKRLMTAIALIDQLKPSATSGFDVKEFTEKCHSAMDDDLNTPILISHLFDGVRVINSCAEGKLPLTENDINLLSKVFHSFVFDIIGLRKETATEDQSQLVLSLMEFILKLRREAKENKDYAASDKIRNELAEMNIIIKDSKDGTDWKYETN